MRRDYSELGRTVGTDSQPRTILDRIWAVFTHPLALSLTLLGLAGVCGLGATQAEPSLDTLGGLRLAWVLGCVLALTFVVGVVLPWFIGKKAHQNDLSTKAALSVHAQIPHSDEPLPLKDILQKHGFTNAWILGRRKRNAFGQTGPIGLVGGACVALGAAALTLFAIIALHQPNPGQMSLVERDTKEAFIGKQNGFDVGSFLGYKFSVDGIEHLSHEAGLEPTEFAPAMTVQSLVDDAEQSVALGLRSRIGLPDGSIVRPANIRRLSQATRARISATLRHGADGMHAQPQVLRLGETLVLHGGEPDASGAEAGDEQAADAHNHDHLSLEVVNVTHRYVDQLGPAVQLMDESGRRFWVFADAPELASESSGIPGLMIELDEVDSGFILTIERYFPQESTLLLIALVLLVIGGALVFSGSHVQIELVDEVDRVVVQGSSLNDMSALPRLMAAIAAGVSTDVSARVADATGSTTKDASVAEEGA